MAGGGSGGTVCVIGKTTADVSVKSIVDEYASITKHSPYVFAGSSPGAMEFGQLIVRF